MQVIDHHVELRGEAAEGVIFESFDPAIHVIDRFDVPLHWERIWSIDFGHRRTVAPTAGPAWRRPASPSSDAGRFCV